MTERTPETLAGFILLTSGGPIDFWQDCQLCGVDPALSSHAEDCIAPVILEHIEAWRQERADAAALRLENEGLRRDREALALGGIPAPVSELAALRERLRLLERAGKQTMFVLTVDVPGYEVDAVVETWKNLLPESPAAGSEEDR